MTELELLQRAKLYMDKLANGIDPVTDTELPGDTALNNVRLARCFFYISDVLRKVIENGGEIQKKSVKKAGLLPFSLLPEQKESIQLFEEPVNISRLAARINEAVDLNVMKNIKVTAFGIWLTQNGYLKEELEHKKRKKVTTEKGNGIGIFSDIKAGLYGEYLLVLYENRAQRFLLDHIDEIAAISNGEEQSNQAAEETADTTAAEESEANI